VRPVLLVEPQTSKYDVFTTRRREGAGNHSPYPTNVMTLLSSIGMAMTPSPILILLPSVCSRVLVTTLVVVGKIHSPGLVLATIPVVVILVASIVDTDLNGGALGGGNSHN
jgi:hypothetical protein